MTRGRILTLLAFLLVLVVSNVTYFRNYGYPRGSVFDESYYVADAQKYLHGVFFMQDHPPLGKLLVAAGEALFRVNDEADDALFVSTPVAHDPPESLSFLGYRFFPALLAWWAAPIFFVVFLTLTGRRRLALLLSAFYLFDNALIVHVRTAMLDGPMIFFAAAAILIFVLLDARPERAARFGWAALFGVTLGLLAATKEPAMILGGLAPFAAWRLRPRWRAAAGFLVVAFVASAIAYAAVWDVHFAIARRVNPALPNGGYFEASPAVRAALDEGRTGSIGMLPAELRNLWSYEAGVNRGIPALDMCSATENGSPPYYWPLGGRAINYRMETGDGHTFRYAYLQSNPVVWWLGLAALLAGTGLVLASPWVPRLRAWPHRELVAAFAALYWIYMIGLSLLPRVLYLYSYFLPLLFTFVIAGALVADAAALLGAWWTVGRRTAVLTGVAAAIVAAYVFFAPLTYFQPLSEKQFARRALVGIWDLTCGSCGRREPPLGCRPSP